MKARVKWIEQRSFAGESGSGHFVMMDGAPESGGRNLAARPMELLLIGMGGCSAFDVVMILEKAREKITDCVVELEAERAGEDPKVFTEITLNFIVTGRNLNPVKVERAVSLSAEKYCSASIMLGKTAKISHKVTIVES
jgi:putative redox protein